MSAPPDAPLGARPPTEAKVLIASSKAEAFPFMVTVRMCSTTLCGATRKCPPVSSSAGRRGGAAGDDPTDGRSVRAPRSPRRKEETSRGVHNGDETDLRSPVVARCDGRTAGRLHEQLDAHNDHIDRAGERCRRLGCDSGAADDFDDNDNDDACGCPVVHGIRAPRAGRPGRRRHRQRRRSVALHQCGCLNLPPPGLSRPCRRHLRRGRGRHPSRSRDLLREPRPHGPASGQFGQAAPRR